ncbi:MAG TPA: Gfo/Idh/MocA family oxidoreductase [Bacteroidetes bacterium]|nr:Gfo/Idh/MocA family oxidoreductase [Bacteroidota bacterium]
MAEFSRREFMKTVTTTAIGAGLVSCASSSSWMKAVGANGDVRIGVVGIRSKGAHHIEQFRQLPGVRVVALCDVDQNILDREVQKFKDRKEKVEAYRDVRNLLDNKEIDAVVIATPNHWHSLISIWACQAGKDVYVEKPVSHNIWEGGQLVKAAGRYNRIVQAGTQNRSDTGLQEAIRYIQEGNLGKIVLARGLCYKVRDSIGKVDGPQDPPATVDYNLWTGPAPLLPLRRKRLHYDWHWVWPTGNGDIGNQGIHEMDIARWALGENELAPSVVSVGGRFGYDDDGQTPNTQFAFFKYKTAPLIFEVHGLTRTKDLRARDIYRGISIGNVIHCENGYFAGGWAYDNDGKKIKQFVRDGGKDHAANFIKAVRSRKRSDLGADILEGHISSALCHMANISYRIGKKSMPEEIAGVMKDNEYAMETFDRFRKHLAIHDVDLEKIRAILGPTLSMDTGKQKFKGVHSDWANYYISRNYRKPFVVPGKI